jgi:hypothetical protein
MSRSKNRSSMNAEKKNINSSSFRRRHERKPMGGWRQETRENKNQNQDSPSTTPFSPSLPLAKGRTIMFYWSDHPSIGQTHRASREGGSGRARADAAALGSCRDALMRERYSNRTWVNPAWYGERESPVLPTGMDLTVIPPHAISSSLVSLLPSFKRAESLVEEILS